MSAEAAGIYLDFSKNRITPETLTLLFYLAEAVGLRARIDAMFRGEKINVSEQRAVLHVALRAPSFGWKHEGLGKPPAMADRSGDAAVLHRRAQRPICRLCRAISPADGGSDIQIYPVDLYAKAVQGIPPTDAVKMGAWQAGEDLHLTRLSPEDTPPT